MEDMETTLNLEEFIDAGKHLIKTLNSK